MPPRSDHKRLERPARERGGVDPWKRAPVAVHLLPDDPSPRFGDDGEPAPRQLREQGGFSAARTAGNDDVTVHRIVERYATMSAAVSGEVPEKGMRLPGMSDCGLVTNARSLSGVH